ncbi:MAG: hypothetical protein V1891_02885 [bacterium]
MNWNLFDPASPAFNGGRETTAWRTSKRGMTRRLSSRKPPKRLCGIQECEGMMMDFILNYNQGVVWDLKSFSEIDWSYGFILDSGSRQE